MTNEKRPLKVFLCHASADKPRVRELYRYLKRRGLQPWLDAEDLLPGQNWQVEIPKALETSDAIIICLSKGSVDKEGYVQKEIKFAMDKALEMPEGRIFLIPARLEECEVPRSLSSYHWVDLFDDGGYEKLMKSLKARAAQLERASVKTPKPAETEPELIPTPELKQSKNKTQVDDQQDLHKFYNLRQHYECDIPNANAETVAKNLFEELTREKRFAEIPDRKNDNQIIRYDTNNRNIEYCDPKTGKTIQYALIIDGTETKLLGKGSIGEWIPRSNVSLKSIPEMLIITVTQGINSSRLNFDSDKLPGDTFVQLVKGILLYLGIKYVPKPDINKSPRKLKTEYIIAIIGAAATILAALIGILPQFFKPADETPKPGLTPTATTPITETSTLTPNFSITPVVTDSINPKELLFSEDFTSEIFVNKGWKHSNSSWSIKDGMLYSDGQNDDQSDRYNLWHTIETLVETGDHIEISMRGMLQSVGNPQPGRGIILGLVAPGDEWYDLRIENGYTNGPSVNPAISFILNYIAPKQVIISSIIPERGRFFSINMRFDRCSNNRINEKLTMIAPHSDSKMALFS